MSLRPSYPSDVVGQGFVYKHPVTGHAFQHPIMTTLHDRVSAYCKANNFTLNNDEFDDNVCRNTPNIVCTEGLRGVGDLVHVVLNPLVKGVDALIGTNLQGCGGCHKRQEALNG